MLGIIVDIVKSPSQQDFGKDGRETTSLMLA